MIIGYSYHGFCQHIANANVAKTPDSQRLMRMQFVDELEKLGCKVAALQPQREEAGSLYKITNEHGKFPEIDALFLEWRWPTWKNTTISDPTGWSEDLDSFKSCQEQDWAEQRRLIQHYTIERDIPTFIHDLDYKFTEDDANSILTAYMKYTGQTINYDAYQQEISIPRIKILDPGLSHASCTGYFKRISVPNYSSYDPEFIREFRKFFPPDPNPLMYGYIGNNYERDQQFERYYGNPSRKLRREGVQTIVYGNWTSRSPERCDPSTTFIKYPNVAFPGRVGFSDAMHRLREFGCVTHIGKDENFAENHVITIRYHEAALCGVPAFVPSCYKHADILGRQWVVSDEKDVLDRVRYVRGMTLQERLRVVDNQIESMRLKCLELKTSVDVRDITKNIVRIINGDDFKQTVSLLGEKR